MLKDDKASVRFVLGVGRRVARGPVMVTCLGSRCWWRAHGPLGYQLTSHPPLSCGTCSSQPDLRTLVSVPSSCHVELGEWSAPLFPCFGYTGLRSRPLHRVPGIFTDPGTYTSLSLPTTISPSVLATALWWETPTSILFSWFFVYFTPQSPGRGNFINPSGLIISSATALDI